MSARETILTALHTRFSMLPTGALRGDVLPERVPAQGLLILRDGEPGNRTSRCRRCAITISTAPR